MKQLLAKIGLPCAIGLLIDEDAVTLSRVAATPLGPVELSRQSAAIAEEDDLAPAIQRLVGSAIGKAAKRRPLLAIGITPRRVYFSTRPIHASVGDSSPNVLLREALRSQNVPVNDMVVDVIKGEPDSRAVASIAACDKRYLQEILDAVGGLQVRPSRVEPAPCALLRIASARHPLRRGQKIVLRLFLSANQVLAVLAAQQMPLLWRFTQLPAGEEAAAIVASYRSLFVTSKDCGVESPIDAVMIHGRMELKRLVDFQWIEDQLDASVHWFDDPALDVSQITLGLAQGAIEGATTGFDLARSSKPRPSLRQLFPWREAILHATLIGCMALLLGYQYWTLREAKSGLEIRMAASGPEAGTTKQQLQNEKKRLEEKILAAREFLGSRVIWTSCLRDLIPRIPSKVHLTSIRGTCELMTAAQKRAGAKNMKSLVLRGAADVSSDGLVPQEIDRFMGDLRSIPSLEAEFPVITLDELTQNQGIAGKPPAAEFSIVCLPGDKKAAPKNQTAANAATGGKQTR